MSLGEGAVLASREGLVVMSVNVIPEGLDELTLDGRTLTIEGAPVYLNVRAVVIGPETEFWVELRGTPAEGAESGG